jgi:hypothetical protein
LKSIKVSGSWHHCGLGVGAATREDIRFVLPQLLPSLVAASGLDYHGLVAVAQNYLRVGEQEIAGLTDYLSGLAAGSGTSFNDILVMAASEELAAWDLEHCSTLAAVNPDGVVLAHNEDYEPWYLGHMAMLDLTIEGYPRVFCLGYPGQLPCVGPSVNETGIAITNNSLTFRARPGAWARARQLRAGLSRSLYQAANVFRSGGEGLANHFFVCDPDRIYSVEVAPTCVAGAEIVEYYDIGPGQCWWHTNHLRYSEPLEAEHASESSLKRAHALTRLARLRDFRPERLLAAFSDSPILKSPELTLATVVIQPKRGIFQCRGWGPGEQLRKLEFGPL